MKRCFLLRAFIVLLWAVSPHSHAAPVRLAQQGRASLPILTSPSAAPETRDAARILAHQLHRITGGSFEIQAHGDKRGIIVGTIADFPHLPSPEDRHKLESHELTHREDYLLSTGERGILLVGATSRGVHHAVWDLLGRIGYRQFFPGPTWEIVPHHDDISLDCHALESPSFHARRIWFGFGALKDRAEPFADWCRKNRATAGIELQSGHSYDGIVHRHKAIFAEHPEYLAQVNGNRRGPKFCTSHPALRRLVVEDALAEFSKNPSLDSISRDPSDGNGWCECESCQKLGSISDRAILLANETAEAVQTLYPGRLVGIYAYNQHSPPPHVPAHPNVVVSIATAFISGGYTVDQLFAGWSTKARSLGVREYYSVNTWDRDLPGTARGANLPYLCDTLPRFHAAGARYISAESSDNFGPNGLGYYIATKVMWDVGTASRLPEHVDEFLLLAFGPARKSMRDFYDLLDSSKRHPLCDDLLGRMYRLLSNALSATADPAIRRRILDLALYARHVELFSDYSAASGAQRQQAFEALIRHAWRIRHTGMIHTLALYRDLANRDKSVVFAPNADWKTSDKNNPWKQDPEYEDSEITTLIARGIASRPLLDFTPVAFSDELVPASPLKLSTARRGSMGLFVRGTRDFWTYVTQTNNPVTLRATAGLVYTNRGNARIEIYPHAEPESRSTTAFDVPPDKNEQNLRAASPFIGLHRIHVSDRNMGTRLDWPEGTPMTLLSDPARPPKLQGRWTLYAYVPKGTPFIGGFANGVGDLLDPSGNKVFSFPVKPGYFRVSVPEGADGKLWCFSQCTGDRLLMTIPPCLAADASELLLPAEVISRDSL